MKRIAVFAMLLAFFVNVSAKADFPKLPPVKNLAGINKLNYQSPIDRNLDKFNSNSLLSPLSLSKKKADKNAYTPKKFNFSINPYAWFMAIGGTVGYYNDQKFSFNKSFSDAVKYLKMAAAVTGKFKYQRVSFVYDISYINLKGFGTTLPATGLPHVKSANWTVKQALYDLFLTYLFPSRSKAVMVDVYAGARLWDLQTESTILDSNAAVAPVMRSFDNSWLDPVIGVNAEYLLSKDMKWFAYTKGDIGGFGVNSQMTWQLTAGAGYMLSPNFPLSLGFKYVGVNYDKNALDWTVNEYGLTLSIGYRY